jgi:hypothetical protein
VDAGALAGLEVLAAQYDCGDEAENDEGLKDVTEHVFALWLWRSSTDPIRLRASGDRSGCNPGSHAFVITPDAIEF